MGISDLIAGKAVTDESSFIQPIYVQGYGQNGETAPEKF